MRNETPALPSTNRIEAFSDGVIAIVITIMVLELKLPENIYATHSLMGIIDLISPKVLSYMLSFVVVAILLVNHHAVMRLAPHATTGLYWWNANLLFWTSLVPFATATMGSNPFEPSAVAFYGLLMCAVSIAFALLHGYAERLSISVRRTRLRNYFDIGKDIVSSMLYAIGAGLAFLSVYIAFAIFVAISAAYFLPSYGEHRYSTKG
ncbi:MAG TPA: TMEM175 family protein [Rhizomicrobium sp.]|jgi:uncharacterized membrane protein